jgi:hypothetical protein
MSQVTTRYLALVTRAQLTEMIAPTYAKLKNIDPNEAYTRLENSLRELELIEGVQRATWRALVEESELGDVQIVEKIAKKLMKPRKWKAATVKSADEGAYIALSVLMDRGAGVGSGEALDLLETPGGKKLLQSGFNLIGRHLAKELLR